jgi:hypothetical protein
VLVAGPTDRGSRPPGSHVACRCPPVGFGRQQAVEAELLIQPAATEPLLEVVNDLAIGDVDDGGLLVKEAVCVLA